MESGQWRNLRGGTMVGAGQRGEEVKEMKEERKVLLQTPFNRTIWWYGPEPGGQ
jgi:hypothetical protein